MSPSLTLENFRDVWIQSATDESLRNAVKQLGVDWDVLTDLNLQANELWGELLGCGASEPVKSRQLYLSPKQCPAAGALNKSLHARVHDFLLTASIDFSKIAVIENSQRDPFTARPPFHPLFSQAVLEIIAAGFPFAYGARDCGFFVCFSGNKIVTANKPGFSDPGWTAKEPAIAVRFWSFIQGKGNLTDYPELMRDKQATAWRKAYAGLELFKLVTARNFGGTARCDEFGPWGNASRSLIESLSGSLTTKFIKETMWVWYGPLDWFLEPISQICSYRPYRTGAPDWDLLSSNASGQALAAEILARAGAWRALAEKLN